MTSMSKLYWRFGQMDSSKTARLLMDAYEYYTRGEYALLLKPSIDTRSKSGMIESRVGLSAPCLDIDKDFNVVRYVSRVNEDKPISCIFVDEAQFLTHEQVIGLRIIVDKLNIPVICYGLKTDFTGKLFDGSQALFQYANRFEEVKTICREKGCREKAMFNVRFKNGKPVFNGDVVQIGDTNETDGSYYYIPKCSKHFFEDFVVWERG